MYLPIATSYVSDPWPLLVAILLILSSTYFASGVQASQPDQPTID